jgi:hypothetical protein
MFGVLVFGRAHRQVITLGIAVVGITRQVAAGITVAVTGVELNA